MFDVLVYLYENYWRPDACPDHDQLTRKLSAVGFESDEIEEALTWLDGLAQRRPSPTSASQTAAEHARVLRRRARAARRRRRSASSASSNPPACCRRRCARWCIDRASAIPGGPLDLEDLKIIVLMVFWSLGEEPDALILDELFVDEEDRLIH